MIERYESEAIRKIWNPENKFRKWLDVEIAVTEVWHAWGKVPDESMKNIRDNAGFDIRRIHEIENKVKHDVIAFLTSVEETIGSDSAYVHKGITSYDIVDTALSLLLRESLDVIIAKCESLKKVMLEGAFNYRDLVSIGRTHGIHAEPVVFGIKYLIWYEELVRNLERLKKARETISVGKISGSVGTYIHFSAEGEAAALKKLDLKPCRVSTQIVQRDRHMEVMFALAALGSAFEKIAVEIRHLQRTDVLEADEPFAKGQKGSSSMPHKRNPVKCERMSGFARLLRGNLNVAMENNVLWHERDISHSSAERVIFPDSFHLADLMADDVAFVLGGLVVYPDNVKRNLDITNEVYYSQRVLTLLLNKGIPRQKVYELVQENAMKSWTEKLSFRDLIMGDERISSLCTGDELEEAFTRCQSEAKAAFGPRLRQLDEMFQGRVSTRFSTTGTIEQAITDADVVVGAVLIPGASAPHLVTRDMLGLMKNRSVLVDVAIDQGGCFETSHATTHENPTYEVDGIIHYCVANMPGSVPLTSSYALGNATLPFGLDLANKGIAACEQDPHLAPGLNVHQGRIVNQAVAQSLGL